MAQSILFYLSLSLFALAAGTGVWAVRSPAPLRVRALRALLGAAAGAVLLLLAVIALRLRALPVQSLFHSLLGVTFLVSAAGLAADAAFRLPALSLAAAGGATLALLGALALPASSGPPPDLRANGWIGLHIACMLLAYSAFALGTLAGALFLWMESCLKRKRFLGLVGGLPSLETLEAIESRMIVAGFVLFTAGLLVGYQEQRIASHYAKEWRTDPKVIWTAATWLAYLVVLAARSAPWLRGRKAAYLTVLGFAFVLFTYFGANYLSAGFHSF